MKNFFNIIILIGSAAALAIPVHAVDWPTNLGWRVESMGGTGLCIQDETTDLTLFNFENIAGLALNKKMDRLDLAAGYSVDIAEEATTTVLDKKIFNSIYSFGQTGTEYQGLTCWLNDNLVVRFNIEGTHDALITDNEADEIRDQLIFQGLGGGAALAFKSEYGLTCGVSFNYSRSNAKPELIAQGIYDVYGIIDFSGNTQGATHKYEISTGNLKWQAGMGVVFDLYDNKKLTLGAHFGSDDEPTDYTSRIEITGTQYDNDVSELTITTPSPFRIGVQGIFSFDNVFEAGLIIDYKFNETNTKNEVTNAFALTESDYKSYSASFLGITPVLRANIPLGEDLCLLPAVMITNWRSGTMRNFRLVAAPDTTSSTITNIVNRALIFGLGVQSISKQIQAAVQLSIKDNVMDSATGFLDNISQNSVDTIRAGAEYWILPVFAIRGGIALITETNIEAITNFFTGEKTDINNLDVRITMGLGLAWPESLSADLLVRLDTYTQDPEPDPNPNHTATGVFLSIRYPL
ncbi:hypothetical protein KAR10_00590 [bacterium]|nr:hypothetical protein [bacterium]